jgi:hypothetical protein
LVNFATLEIDADRFAIRMVWAKSGRTPLPTETMVLILVIQRLRDLSDEKVKS